MNKVYSEYYYVNNTTNYVIFANTETAEVKFLKRDNTLDATKYNDGTAVNSEPLKDFTKITYNSKQYLLLLTENYLAHYNLTDDVWNVYDSAAILTSSDMPTDAGAIMEKMQYYTDGTNEYIFFVSTTGVASYNITSDTWNTYDSGNTFSYNGSLATNSHEKVIDSFYVNDPISGNHWYIIVFSKSVACFDGSTWHDSASGTGVSLSDTGTKVYAAAIYDDSINYHLFIGGREGNVSSIRLDDIAMSWKMYDSGDTFSQENALGNYFDIYTMYQLNLTPKLYLAGEKEAIGTFDGESWFNSTS